jgi:signal transduction histidine kinase
MAPRSPSTAGADGIVQSLMCHATTGVLRSLRRIFTTKPAGTGQGLSLAYETVTRGQGGTLTVESTEGAGSTFVITLPRSKPPVDRIEV